MKRRLLKTAFWLAAVLTLAAKVSEWTAESWFFETSGQAPLFWRMMTARGALFGLGAGFCALALGATLRRAHRTIGRREIAQNAIARSQISPLIPPQDKRLIDRYRPQWSFALRGACALLAGSYASLHWLVMLRALAAMRGPATTVRREAVFGLDVDFYLFLLPALNFAWTFVLMQFVLCLGAAILFYLYEDALQAPGRPWRVAPGVLRHLSALGAALLTWKALGYALTALNLLTGYGAVGGAFDWTAQHIRLPLCTLLAAFSLAVAALIFRAASLERGRLVARLSWLWLLATIAFGWALPWLLTAANIAPQRRSAEQFFAQRADAARAAYGLEQIETAPHSSPSDSELRRCAVSMPAWSPEQLRAHLATRFSGRLDWPHAAVYPVRGEPRLLFVVALWDDGPAPNGQPPRGRLLFVDASRRTPDGQAILYPGAALCGRPTPELRFTASRASETPPWNENAPAAENGRAAPMPDVLKPQRVAAPELSHFIGDSSVVGVPFGGAARRALLAWHFGQARWSRESFAAGARLVWHSNALERCRQLAPFLLFDTPRPLLRDDGRACWLVPGFAVADSYPLAPPLHNVSINYLRLSAWATVDAHSGATQFFASGDEPLTRANQQLFRELLHPFAAMPADVQRHLFYPAVLLTAQSEIYARYLAEPAAALLARRGPLPVTVKRPLAWNPDHREALAATPLARTPNTAALCQFFAMPEARSSTPQNAALLFPSPIHSALLAEIAPGGAATTPRLRVWRPSAPLQPKLLAEKRTAAPRPQSVLWAAPCGSALWLRHEESFNEASSGAPPQSRWGLLEGAGSFAGSSPETALARRWLAKRAKSGSALR